MRQSLASQPCTACRVGAPTVDEEQCRAMLAELPGWEGVVVDDVPRLTRRFRFPDFATALAFSNDVGALAEDANHHPEIVTAWGAVQVSWWTHKIRGLHVNDFIMAARTDELAAR